MPDAAATPPNQPAAGTPAPTAAPAPAATPAPAAAPSTPAAAAPAANVAPQTAAAPAVAETGKPAEAAKAPEAKPADWKLEVPKDSRVTAERAAELEKFAKQAGYSKDQAEKLVAHENEQLAAYEDAWDKQARAHPELKDWDRATDNINRLLNKYASEQERAAFLKAPFFKLPSVKAFLNRMGESLTREAAPVETSPPPASTAQNPADRMYPQYARR